MILLTSGMAASLRGLRLELTQVDFEAATLAVTRANGTPSTYPLTGRELARTAPPAPRGRRQVAARVCVRARLADDRRPKS
jgi:hypothetical protein